MKTVWVLFVAFTVTVSALFLSMPASAQEAANPASSAMSQEQPAAPNGNQNDPSESKSFTGKVVQMGEKLVLKDASGHTVYQLDDQTKAREFLNKNVKVTGVLDVSTGTIRVSAIEPV